jgi:hypothetical protein
MAHTTTMRYYMKALLIGDLMDVDMHDALSVIVHFSIPIY